MQTIAIATATKAVLLLAAVMFLWALLLGIWKYRQMATAESHLAHPYVDTAHRAALLYSFARCSSSRDLRPAERLERAPPST